MVDDILVPSFAARHATFGAHIAADAGLDYNVLSGGIFVWVKA